MLKNYFKIAWRNLAHHKSYTLINILGLTVGMACCVLISLYIKEELSYDRFHEKSDRIVAVGVEGGFFGRSLNTPYPLAEALVDEIPEVEQATRIDGTGVLNLSRDRQNFTVIEAGQYAEPSFFDVFSFDLIAGDREKALSAPNSIVLSQSNSRQIFGDENPVGQLLHWQKRDTLIDLEVTGIVENEPRNSSIHYGALISFQNMVEDRIDPTAWTFYNVATYAVLNSPEALKSLPPKLDTMADKHFKNRENPGSSRSLFSIPLSEVHLSKETSNEGFTGNRTYVYLFGSVALFILLIAGVNYVNLATARASLRSREVGVRKTLGALRSQIAGQFIGESVILSVVSYLLGCMVAIEIMPFFNQLFGTSLVWYSNIGFLLWLMLAAIVIGVLAGLYPSLYLSKFTPSRVLRSQKSDGRSADSLLRKTLVVGQFAIAMVLIIGSLIVYQQLQYTQTKDLGFNGDQVVTVELPNREAWNQRDILRNNLAQHAGIKELSISMGVPGEFNIRLGSNPDSLAPENQVDPDEIITFAPAVVDYNFLDLLDINLIAGRNFSRDRSSDAERAYILNEKGAEMLGWTPEEAVGKSFGTNGGEIIGVVENFHISSLHDDIEGVYLQLHPSASFNSGGILLAKLAADQINSSLDRIKSEVTKFSPNALFSYEFLDDKFDAMYRTEIRFGKIVGLFTLIAIIIACLGLYGLASFSAERRIKEIGIRKVLGATVTNIVGLLSIDFIKLVIIGFVIATPVAWYVMNQWLADFAYRIDLGAGIFLGAGGIAVFIALATISWQSIRAALANPVDSLRSE